MQTCVALHMVRKIANPTPGAQSLQRELCLLRQPRTMLNRSANMKSLCAKMVSRRLKIRTWLREHKVFNEARSGQNSPC